MKFNLFICCFLIVCFPLIAQEEQNLPEEQTAPQQSAQQEQTIFSKTKLRGGWGGTDFSISNVKNHAGYGAGGSIGLIFNSLSVGLFGHGEAYDGFRQDDREYALTLGYGGLMAGYAYPTKKSLHLTGTLKLGAGAVAMARKYNDWDWEIDENDINDAIFVVLPEVGVELNLTHWMRMCATAGYRFVDGFEGMIELNSKDLNAPVFGLNFRFGWFGHGK